MEQTYGSVVIDCGYGKKINLHVSLSMFPFVMFLRLHLALIFLGFSQYHPSFTFLLLFCGYVREVTQCHTTKLTPRDANVSKWALQSDQTSALLPSEATNVLTL